MKNRTKNVVQCGTAFGPSGYGQIIWDFQTGPWPAKIPLIEGSIRCRYTCQQYRNPIGNPWSRHKNTQQKNKSIN